MKELDYQDIQGLVLRGYGEKPEAVFLPLRFVHRERVGHWLGSAELGSSEHGYRPDIPSEVRREARNELIVTNLAVTARGLRTLGYASEQLWRTFTEAFSVGMSAERTRHILNDVSPDKWRWSDAQGEAGVDALWLIYAVDSEALNEYVREFQDAATSNGLEIVGPPLMTTTLRDQEPFGFRDGIAQPHLSHRPNDGGLPAGEVILGYLDEQNRDNAQRSGEAIEGLVENGCYLVMRELAQDVRGFWEAVAKHVDDRPANPAERVRVAAKMVGRWPSGSPMVGGENADPGTAPERLDEFGYRESDPDGYGCPIGSHIRRMNPRDWLFGSNANHARKVVSRRRMIRRGRAFGDHVPMPAEEMAADPSKIPDGDRGLYFVALVADIERQFEFVQQTWANDPSFAGLANNPDPLIGRDENRRMVIQAKPVRERTAQLPEFVRLRGGGYFFLPGIKAVRAMGRRALAPIVNVNTVAAESRSNASDAIAASPDSSTSR